MHPAIWGVILQFEGGWLCKFSVLDCDYIVPDNFVFGYTFSVNTFQQVFNRKLADFDIICTSNDIFIVDILFTMTEKIIDFLWKSVHA